MMDKVEVKVEHDAGTVLLDALNWLSESTVQISAYHKDETDNFLACLYQMAGGVVFGGSDSLDDSPCGRDVYQFLKDREALSPVDANVRRKSND